MEIKINSHWKVGRKNYGYVCEDEQGRLMLLVERKMSQITKFGNTSISHAIQEEVASWAFEELDLITIRTKKIQRIGIIVRDTKDAYFTDLKNYFDAKKVKTVPLGKWGKVSKKALPFAHFEVQRGSVNLFNQLKVKD